MKTTLFIFLLLHNQAFAQTYSAQQIEKPEDFYAILEKAPTVDWTFSKGRNGKSLFVDLEQLQGNSTKICLIREDETLIHQDNHLFELPFNTIYELDLENLKRGVYFVVVHRLKLGPIKHRINI